LFFKLIFFLLGFKADPHLGGIHLHLRVQVRFQDDLVSYQGNDFVQNLLGKGEIRDKTEDKYKSDRSG
jgi:hypothetical protein